ncbi:MAG: nucleoid-associated protein [Zoogloea sp.]|uniref:nucleoid-associated protein n=1 Tax=Zoogloea sp. TaxID=49181 RepID=UPI002609A32D|nr:nucleoid-associated protein [Zoogloea sp.]MDD2987750.1 nucleoid-associated protein [Zoogloea sp.]
MTESTHAISGLVIHRLIRAAEGPSQVELRPAANPLDEPAARLMERLCRHFAERPGKGFGWFEKDERSFPMPRLVREHAIEQSMDFATLSKEMVTQLQQRVDEDKMDEGGYVLIARATVFGADCLYVALLQETLGTVIGDGLSIQDSPHLDFSALQVAGRIDISAWQAGAERYISFLKGRGDVAGWFKRFLGCTDVVIALKETKKLVETLSHFAETQQLDAAERDELLERAHLVLEEMGDSGAALNLEAVAGQIFPDAPQKLSATLQDEALDLASGFVPDKRALRPLIRFKASAEDWKLEFERSGLRSGAVQYDKASNTLVLTNVPENLKKLLLEE